MASLSEQFKSIWLQFASILSSWLLTRTSTFTFSSRKEHMTDDFHCDQWQTTNVKWKTTMTNDKMTHVWQKANEKTKDKRQMTTDINSCIIQTNVRGGGYTDYLYLVVGILLMLLGSIWIQEKHKLQKKSSINSLLK